MVLRFVWPDRPPVKYLQNVWYVAAWDTEVPADRPFGRMLLGEPVVFFRDTAGAVHALADQCPHRFAPLSKGRVKGDGLECGYPPRAVSVQSNGCIRVPRLVGRDRPE